MSQLYRQTCINGHPATVSPDNAKPWRCGDPECEYFEDADDTAYGRDTEAEQPEYGTCDHVHPQQDVYHPGGHPALPASSRSWATSLNSYLRA